RISRVRRFFAVLVLILPGGLQPIYAAAPDPVQWSATATPPEVKPGGKVLVALIGTVQPGWHLYSMTTPSGGPNPTTIKVDSKAEIAAVHVFQGKPERHKDPSFNLETETFETEAKFLIEFETSKAASVDSTTVRVQVRYQACQDRLCLAPKTKTVEAQFRLDS